MATVIIDGKEYEYTVINGTQDSISTATTATNIYVDKYSKFKLDTKVQIKYGMKGGDGNDVMYGKDFLEGGSGFDTYIAGNNDTIIDNDNKGRVLFNGKLLSGGEWDKDKNAYVGDGGKYTQTSER